MRAESPPHRHPSIIEPHHRPRHLQHEGAPSLSRSRHASETLAYLATVARNADCRAYRVGGVADPVHLAIRMSRTITIAKWVETLKTASSKWPKTESPDLAAFSWQRGYGCLSVGPSDLEALKDSIDHQEEHHKSPTFQDEFRMLLKKYRVEYDEAYVWD